MATQEFEGDVDLNLLKASRGGDIEIAVMGKDVKG